MIDNYNSKETETINKITSIRWKYQSLNVLNKDNGHKKAQSVGRVISVKKI